MIKLKHHRIAKPQIRRLSPSIAVAAAATPQQTLDRKPPNSEIPIYSNPNFYISTLLNIKTKFQIKQIHALATANGMVQSNINVTNKLIYMYGQFNGLSDAYQLFDEMSRRDPVSWSLMVGGFAKAGEYSRCFETFKLLISSRAKPDSYNLPFVLRLCRDVKDLVMGRSLHGVVLKFGLGLDQFVCACIVDMYARCGEIDDARYLFDKLGSKDIVTWTVMMGAFADSGKAKESLALFDRMIEEGVIIPNKVTMVSVVNACAKFGSMHKAKAVHNYISEMKFSLDVILGSAIIDMYAKCGSVDAAREIFDKMKIRNVISWSAMIAAYGYHGQGQKALDLFHMMLSNGIIPNKITFVSLLYACSHAGLIEEGFRLFSLMQDDYGMEPGIKHYTCMVDLLARAGRLNEAMDFIENIPIDKDEGIWGALLGACRIHKNTDLVEKAANSLLELRPEKPAHYILLSNIYANAGKWHDVAEIRDLMSRKRLKKVPGWTWIEIGDKIYQFSVGDRTHPRSNEIYRTLKDLVKKLELAGYIPDTNCVLHDVDEEVKRGMLSLHSEKLAIAFGLIATPDRSVIRITKNLRVCYDCHTFIKYVSAVTQRVIVVRDTNRFHHFEEGKCSCEDYW